MDVSVLLIWKLFKSETSPGKYVVGCVLFFPGTFPYIIVSTRCELKWVSQSAWCNLLNLTARLKDTHTKKISFACFFSDIMFYTHSSMPSTSLKLRLSVDCCGLPALSINTSVEGSVFLTWEYTQTYTVNTEPTVCSPRRKCAPIGSE